MRYEVRVTNADGSEGRFKIERDEAIEPGDVITQGTMIYKALRILPGSGEFDAVVEAERLAGPGQFVREDGSDMNEQGDPNPAEGRAALDVLKEKAWAALPDAERERLQKLWDSRDSDGERLWFQRVEDDPEDPEWRVLWLLPVRDLRPGERIGHWHVKQEADEHNVDD